MTTTVNSALASQPIPLRMNINQISYMSCGQAGTTYLNNADPLANPYYHIRFGAFDNSNNNGFLTIAANSGNLTYGNQAGISFTPAAVAYLKGTGSSVPASSLQGYLNSSPYTNAAEPVAAVINMHRSTSSLAPAFSSSSSSTGTPVATTFLMAPNNTALGTALENTGLASDGGTTPNGYFANIGYPGGSLIGTLNFPVENIAGVQTSLINDYIFLGFSNTTSADATTIIQNMEGPDADPSKRLFGLGYRFTFNYNDSSVNAVQEWNLNNLVGQDAQVTGETWNCFYTTVVRDVDRKYYTTTAAIYLDTVSGQTCSSTSTVATCKLFAAGAPIHPTLASIVGSSVPLQTNYYQSSAEALSVYNALVSTYSTSIVTYPGTTVACPTENPQNLTTTQLDQLKVMRRFLSPDMWDINVSAGCATPTSIARSSGAQCYVNGDSDNTKYVQYNTAYTCGSGQVGECPARISFCYRSQ